MKHILSPRQQAFVSSAKTRSRQTTVEVSAYCRVSRRLTPKSEAAALQQWVVFEKALLRLCSATDRRRRFSFDKRCAKFAIELLTDTFKL